MDPMQNNEGRTPFEDLTNKIIGGGQTSNLQEQVDECAKRKREREKARHAAMTQEQKDERNKKQKEEYHQRKADTAAAGSRVGVESTTKGSDDYEDSDWLHRNDSYEPMQIDEDNARVVNTPGSINNIVTCPKERKHELDRARRAAMSPEQKALLNKRRRVLYAQKTATRKLQMTPQEREEKRKEMKRNYNKSVREHRASHLHPDSIAMESPHFNPQIIFPTPQLPKATSQDMEIPELTGTPIHIAPAVVQTPEVQDHELMAHTIHRHRVTPGERNLLMSRRNETFEASIGRRARGCANGKCSEGNDPTQPSVVYNDGVTQESSVPRPNNCTGTQTQPAVVDGTSPMPTNGAQDDTPDTMVEDDYDADIIFEDDEEEEAYFFAGQDAQEEEAKKKEKKNAKKIAERKKTKNAVK